MMEEEFKIKPCSFEHAGRLKNIFILLIQSQSKESQVISFQAFTCVSLKKKKNLEKQINKFYFRIKIEAPHVAGTQMKSCSF